MTRDSPDPPHDGNTTSTLAAEESVLDSPKQATHSPFSDDTMMAVLPHHGSSLHEATPRRTNTSENAVVATTHDSTPRTISTAISTASKNVRSDSLTHVSNDHVETTASLNDSSTSPAPAIEASQFNQQVNNTSETTIEVTEPSSAKSTTTETEPESTEIETTMCKPSTSLSASEAASNDQPKELPSATSAEQDINENSSTEMHVSNEDQEQDDDDDSASENSENEAKSPARKKRTLPPKPGQSQGRWTHEEHQAFLAGLKVYGREWKKVAEQIPTRTSAQIRSHAQKYFAKIAREESMLLQEQAAFEPAPPAAQGPSASPLDALPPSAQRNAERIMADPSGVQQEVEDTLRALQARYRELQIQLEERNRARQLSLQRQQQQDMRRQSQMERRKRTFTDLTLRQRPPASSAPPQTSPVRELASQELIAVAVLGGALPRSASKQDLEAEEQKKEEQTTDQQQDTTNSTDNKRPRLSSDSDTDGDGMML